MNLRKLCGIALLLCAVAEVAWAGGDGKTAPYAPVTFRVNSVTVCPDRGCPKPLPCPPCRPALNRCATYCAKPLPCPPCRPALSSCTTYGCKPQPNLCSLPRATQCCTSSCNPCQGK